MKGAAQGHNSATPICNSGRKSKPSSGVVLPFFRSRIRAIRAALPGVFFGVLRCSFLPTVEQVGEPCAARARGFAAFAHLKF
jgi:hypothetical protein